MEANKWDRDLQLNSIIRIWVTYLEIKTFKTIKGSLILKNLKVHLMVDLLIDLKIEKLLLSGKEELTDIKLRWRIQQPFVHHQSKIIQILKFQTLKKSKII